MEEELKEANNRISELEGLLDTAMEDDHDLKRRIEELEDGIHDHLEATFNLEKTLIFNIILWLNSQYKDYSYNTMRRKR